MKSHEIENFNSQKIDIRYAVKNAIQLNKDLALDRNIFLRAEVVKTPSPINLNPERVSSILANLVSEAVKQGKSGSEVVVVAKMEEDFLEVSVIDQSFKFTKPEAVSKNSRKSDLSKIEQLIQLENGIIENCVEDCTRIETKIRFPYVM